MWSTTTWGESMTVEATFRFGLARVTRQAGLTVRSAKKLASFTVCSGMLEGRRGEGKGGSIFTLQNDLLWTLAFAFALGTGRVQWIPWPKFSTGSRCTRVAT